MVTLEEVQRLTPQVEKPVGSYYLVIPQSWTLSTLSMHNLRHLFFSLYILNPS